jgi:hypothetical protein
MCAARAARGAAKQSRIAAPCCNSAATDRVAFYGRSSTMMRRRKRNPWTPSDLKQLKRLAGRISAPRIARELRRTEGAVRVRASQEGVSLRVPAG